MGETEHTCHTQAQDLVTDTQDMAQVQAQEDMALDSPRDGALQSTVPHADIQAQPPPPGIQQASQDQGTAIQAGSRVQDMAVTATLASLLDSSTSGSDIQACTATTSNPGI